MEERNYNTSVNVLGSIPNINIIIETIKYYNQCQDIKETKEEFVEGNAFGFNLTSSRKRFFSLIKKLFLKDPEDKANKFFIEAISSDRPDSNFKKAILYLEVYRKNDLFRDITRELIYAKYHDNRRLTSTQEIFDFLLDFGEGTKIVEYSESTVKTIASKYRGFMKRLGYFEKAEGSKSMIAYPYPSKDWITYIVYLLKAEDKKDPEIFNSDMFDAFMLKEDEKIELLKQGSLAGYYDFDLSGDGNATFSLSYSGEEIIDELFG